MKLVITYSIVALIATLVNIGTQNLVVYIYSGSFYILASIFMGTGVGLVVKYILDKSCVFRFHTKNAGHASKTFALYTFMGLTTTLIFWGVELCFNQIFESNEMRYLGGIIGLTIGYTTKYYLDKRYVFAQGSI